MSLRLRLALIFAASSLGTLLVASGFLYWSFQRETNLRNRRLLEARIQEVASILAHLPSDGNALEEEIAGEIPSALEPQVWLRVLEGRGPSQGLVVQTPGMAKRLPAASFSGQEKIRREKRYYLLREQASGNHLIQGGLDITEDERLIASYQRRLAYTLLLGATASALLGWWAARKGLRPLGAIAESTLGITPQRLSERLDPGTVPQELRDLVLALNAMLDRLDRAFDRLSRFSADLAHELRTPVTNLMGEAEVTLSKDRPAEDYRQVLESNMEEYQRLSRLISRMLFLARAEDPHTTLALVPIEASRLAGDVLAYFEAAAEEQGVSLRSEASGTFSGDAELLRQALANLISNALEATPPGGEIKVAIQSRDETTELSVIDTGRGIASEDMPHILDRFYRTQKSLDQGHPGTGLGLAIVQSIASLHGGQVTISSEEGKGTLVSMRIPL